MSFYVGQSVNTCRTRTNGHRAKFNTKYYTKSALSVHMFRDHPEFFDSELQFGGFKVYWPSTVNLDRLEG